MKNNPNLIVHFNEQYVINKINNSDYPIYDGDTIIVPKIEDQTLETANKIVLSDICVLKIPRSDVLNSSGGITTTIG